jgi:hypothetical protein
MTPIVFITFLISLSLVDYRYSVMRSHYHADGASRFPAWLHRIIYRYQPYQYVEADKNGKRREVRFYHSKQTKLLRMEAAEAFQMRGTVLLVLGVLGLGFLWLLWRAIAQMAYLWTDDCRWMW